MADAIHIIALSSHLYQYHEETNQCRLIACKSSHRGSHMVEGYYKTSSRGNRFWVSGHSRRDSVWDRPYWKRLVGEWGKMPYEPKYYEIISGERANKIWECAV